MLPLWCLKGGQGLALRPRVRDGSAERIERANMENRRDRAIAQAKPVPWGSVRREGWRDKYHGPPRSEGQQEQAGAVSREPQSKPIRLAVLPRTTRAAAAQTCQAPTGGEPSRPRRRTLGPPGRSRGAARLAAQRPFRPLLVCGWPARQASARVVEEGLAERGRAVNRRAAGFPLFLVAFRYLCNWARARGRLYLCPRAASLAESPPGRAALPGRQA